MRRIGLRRRLIVLTVAAIVPLAGMSGVGLVFLVQQQREQAQRSSLDLSRALAAAVDAQLRSSIAILDGLATSPAFDQGDARGFYPTAKRVLATRPRWRAIIVHDPAGHAVLHTSYPPGPVSVGLADTESFERLLRTHADAVGALRRGQRGEFGIPVRVPVMRDGTLRYVLTAVLDPDAILEVITHQRVPGDWIVSVFDARMARVARSRNNLQYLGTPPAPSLRRLIATGADEGTGITDTMEGEAVFSAFARLQPHGWVIALGIPLRDVESGVYRSALAYGTGIALSALLGVLASLAIARGISRPIGELRRAAQALGRGELPIVPAGDIPEVQEVADALSAAAAQRARDVAERERLLSAERAARAVAEQARRRLELLASAGAVLSRSLQPSATLEAIASVVVPGIADWCRVDLVNAQGELERALAHHADPLKSQRAMDMVQRMRASSDTPGSMAWTVTTGRAHLAHYDGEADFDRIADPALRTFVRDIGMRASFVVPLVARGRTLGALAAMQAESDRRFSDDDCALLSELAQRAALALDNARLYADAQAARSQAETANRVKDEFLAMLGHELRNPLAPIVTALTLMSHRPGSDTTMERHIIERQVAHLLRLVDDLLDVSRIARGKIALQRERVDMRAVVERALELTQPALERRSMPVELHWPDAPAFVSGDAVRLAQVVTNLLTNAAKFTPPNRRIAVRLRHVDGDVELVVEDQGCGIAPALLPRVFDLFTQGEQGVDRHAGGLGLGLAIVKTLVQLHGGSVHAESEGVGRGTRFVVRLPEVRGPADVAPPLPDAAPAVSRNGRILVVDDNEDAAEMLRLLLEEQGHEVCCVADGAAALSAIEHFTPDIGVLDIGLPGMDGYELAARLRADPRASRMKLIALTGYGSEQDRARALASHFDEHLVKPVPGDKLLDVVARLMPVPA